MKDKTEKLQSFYGRLKKLIEEIDHLPDDQFEKAVRDFMRRENRKYQEGE